MRAALFALGFAAACSPVTVHRLDTGEQRDLSGRWNDADAQLVAKEMIADSLFRPWLAEAETRLKRHPAVIVGRVRNQSFEHINTDVFVEELQRALINSSHVNFVASSSERGELRDERLDQDSNSSDATRKAHGEETGADFMLSGAINAVQDKLAGDSIVFYQVNLKLTDLKTNGIVWNGQKQIKKNIVRSSVSW
jgi:uncharacterized protein (TIGR02722 family)